MLYRWLVNLICVREKKLDSTDIIKSLWQGRTWAQGGYHTPLVSLNGCAVKIPSKLFCLSS